MYENDIKEKTEKQTKKEEKQPAIMKVLNQFTKRETNVQPYQKKVIMEQKKHMYEMM